MEAIAILKPVFAMGLLTLMMTVWLLIARIPAMTKLKIHPQQGRDTAELRKLLPDSANGPANNYNHLFEQPVVFYAVCISLALLNHVDSFFVNCAWIYVALRVVHSLIQATIDIVTIRFYVFLTSWIVLATMIVRESIAIFL